MKDLNSALLKECKNYLDITWEDTAGDEKLTGMILRGMKRLNKIAGSELDFLVEEEQRELLFIRVMYERAAALDDFEKNYRSELISLRNKERVKRYVEKKQDN